MEFSFSDEQNAIRDLAGQIFADLASDEQLLAMRRAGQDYNEKLWATLAEQGILGLVLPEALDGSALGLTELCLVLEEQGKHVAPVPLYANLVLGALPIIEFGSEAQQQQLLTGMAQGDHKLTAALAELAMQPQNAKGITAQRQGDQWVLNGMVDCVQDGAVARYVLLPARHAAGQAVFVLDTESAGVTVTPQQLGLLGAWNARIELNGVQLSDEALLGQADQGAEIVEWLEQRANIAHCALQAGVSESAMRRTAEYTGERSQFGVPIGSFQALAMRMADAYIDVESIRSTYWLALWRLSNGKDARAEIRAAKFWACEGAHRVVCTAQHLHGGIGADVEYPIHRYFLWSKMIAYSLGGGSHQLHQLGALLASNDNLGLTGLEA